MKKIYYEIYGDLREKTMPGVYPYQSYIPSELQLVEEYECSHNTVRKAISVLTLHGFVQPIRGKGVVVIWQPRQRTRFELGGIETFQEAAKRCGLEANTRVRLFEHVIATREIAIATQDSWRGRSWFISSVSVVSVESISFSTRAIFSPRALRASRKRLRSNLSLRTSRTCLPGDHHLKSHHHHGVCDSRRPGGPRPLGLRHAGRG